LCFEHALGGPFKTHFRAPPPRVSGFVGRGGAGVICMSDKFPGHAAVATGVEITF